MRTCKADAAAFVGYAAEHGGTFHHLESVVAEIAQHVVVGRDSGSIYHQRFFRVAEFGRYGLLHVVDEADARPFGGEVVGEFRGGAVVACHRIPLCHEVAFESCHSNAPGAYEI